MLRLQKLTKTCKTGDQALEAIDLDVPKGQLLALIGPSGAGTSTMIRCINRLVEPTSGAVMLDDSDLTRLGSGALRRARREMGMMWNRSSTASLSQTFSTWCSTASATSTAPAS